MIMNCCTGYPIFIYMGKWHMFHMCLFFFKKKLRSGIMESFSTPAEQDLIDQYKLSL